MPRIFSKIFSPGAEYFIKRETGVMKKYENIFTNPQVTEKISQIENSLQMQEKLAAIKADMKSKTSNPFLVGIFFVFSIIVLLEYTHPFLSNIYENLSSLQSSPYYLYLILIPVFFIGRPIYEKFTANKADVKNSYINNFLTPVLEEIFPGTTLNYSEGLSLEVCDSLLPNSNHYQGNCHIVFADELRTEFSNMYAFHYIRNSKGEREESIDFIGQVFLVRLKTGVNGHLRVVPVKEKVWMGKKTYGVYGGRRKDEEEIQTESLAFNDGYSIFATDDFYSKLILDPQVIEIFNSWMKKMDVALYMNAEYIALAFQSSRYLFSVPTTKGEVENLSLAGEYEKVRDKLADFYELVAAVAEKI